MPLEISQKGEGKQPWPAYFLVRTTGEVVPLVAVDELPPSLDLVGVPRSIELEDTIGMLNLGLRKGCGDYYRITHTSGLMNGAGGRGRMAVTEREGKVATTIDQFPGTRTHHKSSSETPPDSPGPTPPNSPSRRAHTQAQIPTTLAAPPSPTHIHTAAQPQTQLCRHWCHHGICKWGQKCRYRHIMPMTLSGLEEVGLLDWPAWYREMNPGYFVSESMGSFSPKGVGRSRRARGLTNTAGNAGCCGGHSNGAGARVAKAERLRGGARVTVKDKATGRVMKSEELGEQIIARLKGMERDARVKKEKEQEKGPVSSSVLIDRATARDTRRWEDESETAGEEEVEEESEIEEVEKKEGKLVEV